MRRAVLIALLGAALAVAGAAFGTSPLIVPGCALVLLAIGALAWVGIAGLGSAERRVGARRVVEGEPCRLTVEARCPIGPPPGSELVEPYAPEAARPAEWRRAHRIEAAARFSGRGRRRLEPARLVLRDPLGLAVRELRSPPGPEVLVLPRVASLHVGRGGGRHTRGDAATSAQTVEEGPRVELDTLREVPEGAAPGRIHWPAVARTGTLIERTLFPEAGHRPLVVVDTAHPSSPEALDDGVRAAASLCVALARAGGCEVLLPGDRRPSRLDRTLAGWAALHTRLALVEEAATALPHGRLAPAGAIFWVTGREQADGAELPLGLRRSRAPERFLVSPGPGGAASAFEVAGCHGRRLGRASGRAAA